MEGTDSRFSAAARRGLDIERAAGTSIVPTAGLATLHKGDPCFPTPPHIVKAAHDAVEQGFTHYPPPLGDTELRDELAELMSRQAVGDYTRDQVLVTTGASEAIYCALSAFLDPGDEVLLFDPSYSGYAPVVRQAGGEPIFVGMTADFRLDRAKLAAAVTERTRLIVINNPINPTGVVLSRQELESLADVADDAGLLVLADEVYDHLVFGPAFVSTLAIPRLSDRLLYVNSFSKTYAMTGWRLGWLATPADLFLGPETIHRNCVGSVHWPTQRAGVVALRSNQNAVREMHDGYKLRRDTLLEGLRGTPGLAIIPPEGAFYAFVRFSLGEITSAALAQRLLREGVAVRSGTEYGAAGEGHLRIAYSADLEDIRIGAERIHRVFEELS
jgi:aspartate/methionine/tyrosine aminotransferase